MPQTSVVGYTEAVKIALDALKRAASTYDSETIQDNVAIANAASLLASVTR